MQREKFIDGLNSGVKFTNDTRREIMEKAIEHTGRKSACVICMEELAELQQQISKQIRECGDQISLLEEMADAYICLKYLEIIFGIHPEQIQKAIDVKLLREKGRLND